MAEQQQQQQQQAGQPEANANPHIQIKVKDQSGSETFFKIKNTTPLRKLMDAYCQRIGLQQQQVRFMVDGERIGVDDTAEKLGLVDMDMVDVMIEQTGGSGLALVAGLEADQDMLDETVEQTGGSGFTGLEDQDMLDMTIEQTGGSDFAGW